MLLRTLGIVVFVTGFVAALLDFAGHVPGQADSVWIWALAVAAIGAAVGVLLRKRRAELTVSNVVWRIAPLTGITVGMIYIVIVIGPGGDSAYLGISLLAGAGTGLVWGCLCAGGAVLGSKIAARFLAVAVGSVLGAIVAGILTSWMFQDGLAYIAFGAIITLAILLALALVYRGSLPINRLQARTR
jgi:energy-coupling factor transporter transmembrane protein EcfT